ncbi:MAG: Fe3+-siderophores ABC transporter protein [Telmatospirillum sp.]|nr:Fe3+-siderophores ABC transporter protein [Telmatospirillum sp.]
MRVVSLVPSWTETLLAAGVEVIGRTRYCIHPADRVDRIPVLGGTKAADFAVLEAMRPDLVLIDREENTREMAAQVTAPLLVTHVRTVRDAADETARLARELRSARLSEQAERWRRIIDMGPFPPAGSLSDLPGVLSWWIPAGDSDSGLVYLIWGKPWMAAGPGTFIGDMLRWLGYGGRQLASDKAYPEIVIDDLPASTALLCSSEPYPFQRFEARIRDLGRPAALVDGECYSWFGIRALRFLERCRGLAEEKSGAAP